MSSYVLSRAAEADIEDIAHHSIALWGFGRTERYLLELHRAFETLAEFPQLGRDAAHLRSGYFRFEHQSHSIFYQKIDAGVFIIRVLHQRQQPENHL